MVFRCCLAGRQPPGGSERPRAAASPSSKRARAEPTGERLANKSVSFDAGGERIPPSRVLRRYSTRGLEPTRSILRESATQPVAADAEYLTTQTVTTLTEECEWMSACSHLEGWNDEWDVAEVDEVDLDSSDDVGEEEWEKSGGMASSAEHSVDEGAADDNEFLEIVRAWRRLKLVDGEMDSAGFIAGLQANMMVVDALGAAFRLIKKDVDMNCEKIESACKQRNVSTVQGVLLAEGGKGPGTSSVRWMKRMLQFTYCMFSEYYGGRGLPDSANLAYKETLHDCHPMLVRNLARGIRLVVPTGATFSARLDPDPAKVQNGVYDFLEALHPQLEILVGFFNEHGFEPVEKCCALPRRTERR